ncbi:hypothetical protein AVEN_206482-1 [Araneus ventricosus]|uniref:GP-PDE domain-containing protein n=1 Tax=Araneus ventricosus TaxID=182803 RepID=A0A4Y2E9S7_ARAVE|nr:hypothetical protein AVEN_206482-1 [Araneus ventricosus]
MEESEYEDFGSFQQEREAVEMDEEVYLESSMVDFSPNLFVLIDTVGGARMKRIIHTSPGFKKLGVDKITNTHRYVPLYTLIKQIFLISRLGVDALITNYPQNLFKILKEDGLSQQARLATFEDNPWKQYIRGTERSNSFQEENSTFYEEEILYN